MEDKILIIDGTYLAYRSYYALNKSQIVLVNDQGIETNTIVLFFSTLFNLIKENKPTHLLIAFDAKEETFRHKIYQAYKEGRIKMPKEFYDQMDLIKKLLSYLKIRNVEKNGYEADDIIAKICAKYPQTNKIIFSADQDLNQLIDAKTSIIKKIKNAYTFLTKDNFKEIYFIEPNQVIDYKAIIGDSSDNFLGIKGIGPKTAAKLLSEYQTLENIYANLNALKNTIANKFEDYKNIVFRNQEIAKLVTDFEIANIEKNDLDITQINLSIEALKIIEQYQLNSIKNQILKLKK